MKSPLLILATFTLVILASCAPSRTPFSPDGPTTVGMPEKLSDRERSFVPEIDAALRSEGFVPVRHGKGDLQLDFTMSSGPINIETYIALLEDEAVLHSAKGRSGGVPLIGRENVARKSFDEALTEFQSGLSRAASNRGWSGSSSGYGSSNPGSVEDELPVY
ncbi:MAG: hypothetical protein V4727_07520 [Verrucomicrobiota bacterium]